MPDFMFKKVNLNENFNSLWSQMIFIIIEKMPILKKKI